MPDRKHSNTMAVLFFVDSFGERPILKLEIYTSNTMDKHSTMDVSCLVDFSGEKPVLKPGGWTPSSYPIVSPTRREGWFNSILRNLSGRT